MVFGNDQAATVGLAHRQKLLVFIAVAAGENLAGVEVELVNAALVKPLGNFGQVVFGDAPGGHQDVVKMRFTGQDMAQKGQAVDVASADDVPGFALGEVGGQDGGKVRFGVGAAHVVAVGAFHGAGFADFGLVDGELARCECDFGGVEALEQVRVEHGLGRQVRVSSK